jgi:hypothetical protein
MFAGLPGSRSMEHLESLKRAKRQSNLQFEILLGCLIAPLSTIQSLWWVPLLLAPG